MVHTSITPNLWFSDQAEEAVNFYLGIFKNSRILHTTRYSKVGNEVHHMPEGTILTIDFELDGNRFVALNGGPIYTFSEGVSFIISCNTQQEIDHYWNSLTAGGDPKAQQCGWLKDKFGLSWQVVPESLVSMMTHPDTSRSQRVMSALMQMKKIDLPLLTKAFNGE